MATFSRVSRVRGLPHALPCKAAVRGAFAPRGRLSLPPQALRPALCAGPEHPALRASWTLLSLPQTAPFAAGLPRGPGRRGLLRARGAAEGPGTAACWHGPNSPGCTDPAGSLTHHSGACPQSDKGRRRARSIACASGTNYNSQEAPRGPARQAPGLGGHGFSKHCGKRSSAARPASLRSPRSDVQSASRTCLRTKSLGEWCVLVKLSTEPGARESRVLRGTAEGNKILGRSLGCLEVVG